MAVTCRRQHLPVADRFRLRSDVRVVRELRRLLRSGAFDAVHVHGLKALLLASVAAWPRPPLPMVYTLHNSLPAAKFTLSGCRREALLRWALRQAQAVIVVSQAQAADLERRRLQNADQVHVVPNGIALAALAETHSTRNTPLSKDAARARLGVLNDVTVLTVARAISAKGLDDLIDAAQIMRRLPPPQLQLPKPVRFLIAGDGPELSRLVARVEEEGLSQQVRFLGHRSDVPVLLQAADIFLLPSHSEGMPLTIMEAMAAGLPVLATNVGGIPEVVVDDVTGILVPPHEPKRLAEALSNLAADAQLCNRMGAAGRDRVEQHFTQEKMLAAVETVYEQVLSHA